MKILHVFLEMPVGGAEDLVLSLMRNAPEGVVVEALCLKAPGVLGAEAVKNGSPVHVLPLVKSKRLSVGVIWKLSRWIREHGYSHVHSHVYNAHIYAVPAARLAGVPAVMHHHKTFAGNRLHRWIFLRVLAKLAHAQIALSGRTEGQLRVSLNARRERSFHLENAVDSVEFRPADDKGKAKRNLHFSEEGKTFGSVASLTAPKNHRASIEALSVPGLRGEKWSFVICGEGPLRGELEQSIRSHGLGEKVRLAGNQRPVAPWMQAFDFLLMPSTWEGQPMTLLQAVLSGLPVIASRIEGNVAVLGVDHPGLYELGNGKEYSDLLEKALMEPNFGQEILGFQKNLIKKITTVSEYWKKLREIYEFARR